MKYTSTVYAAASGSVGGLTYSRNRGGPYTRTRTIPSNPATERQGVARENLAASVTWWTNTLTPAQREGWQSYAAATPFVDSLGAQIILSGQQIFIRTSTVRGVMGATQIFDAPVMSGLGNTPQWAADPEVAEDSQLITGDITADGAAVGDIAGIYISRPTTASRTPAHEPKRYCAGQVYVALGTHFPIALASAFAVVEGQRVRVTAFIAYADGRISAEAFRDIIVVDTAA